MLVLSVLSWIYFKVMKPRYHKRRYDAVVRSISLESIRVLDIDNKESPLETPRDFHRFEPIVLTGQLSRSASTTLIEKESRRDLRIDTLTRHH